MELKTCPQCTQRLPIDSFWPRGGMSKYRIAYCKSCAKKRQQAYRGKIRREVLDKYGKVCQCCGESTIQFLAIDHINGGGRKHQLEVGQGFKFYYWLRKSNYPFGFRVLCHNCNFGRFLNGGTCPHTASKILSN